jgi:hypothetical protein
MSAIECVLHPKGDICDCNLNLFLASVVYTYVGTVLKVY